MDGRATNDAGDGLRYASFILRCAVDGYGRIRARVIAIDSGASHPVASLAALPDLLERLLEQQGDDPRE